MAKTIADYQADWWAANEAGDKDAMEAAHAGAEALRSQYGYSGGADGSANVEKDQQINAQLSGNSGGSSGGGSSSSDDSGSSYTPTYVAPATETETTKTVTETPAATTKATYTQGTYSTSSNTGKKNESVTAIQQTINDWIKSGASGSEGINLLVEDGLYGAKTQAAVKAYQKAKGISSDGIVGNETAATMGLLNDGSAAKETEATVKETDTATKDAELRASIWDTSLDKYGTSADYSAVAANAYQAGDLASAAKAEQLRNQYIKESGNTAWGDQSDTYIKQYEVYSTDANGNATKDNNSSNSTTYSQPTKTTSKTTDGVTVTYYTFTDVNGNEHISAKTTSGDPLADGAEILVDSETSNGKTFETVYTWTPDGFRGDTGAWTETVSVKSEYDTTAYSPGTFIEYVSSDDGVYISDYYDEISDAEVAAINAATQKAILEIQQDLAESEAEFATMADEAYLQSQYAQDNLVLQNAAAGNYGGIAQKQYSAAQASYDQQLLAISLQYQALKTEADYKIAELQAEGEMEAAEAVATWANQKLETMLSAYQWTEEMKYSVSQYNYEKETTDRNYAFQRAQSMLEQGVLTADAVEALGVSEEDAQDLADYYNTLAQVNLQSALAGLKQTAEDVDDSNDTDDSGSSPEGASDTGLLDSNGNSLYYDPNTKQLLFADGSRVPEGYIVTDDDGNSYVYENGGLNPYSDSSDSTGNHPGGRSVYDSDNSDDHTGGGRSFDLDPSYTGEQAKEDKESSSSGYNWESTKDYFSSGLTLEEYLRNGGYQEPTSTDNFYNATGPNGEHFTNYEKDIILAAAEQVADMDYSLAAEKLQKGLTNDQIWELGPYGLREYFSLYASNDIQTPADVVKSLYDDYIDSTLTYNQALILAELMSVKDQFNEAIRVNGDR